MPGRNTNPIKVPYHRIVTSNGKMGSCIHGIAKRKELLEKEDMLFKNDAKLYNFKTVRFYPNMLQSIAR